MPLVTVISQYQSKAMLNKLHVLGTSGMHFGILTSMDEYVKVKEGFGV